MKPTDNSKMIIGPEIFKMKRLNLTFSPFHSLKYNPMNFISGILQSVGDALLNSYIY
jgi:hypothetical protein